MRERGIRHLLIKGQCDLLNQACTRNILGTLACCYYCVLFSSGEWGGENAASTMRSISGMIRVKKEELYAEMIIGPWVVAHLKRGLEVSTGQEQRTKGDVDGFTPGLLMGGQLFPEHHRGCSGHRRPGQIFIPHCILWLNLVNVPASSFALFISQAIGLGQTQHKESELWTPARIWMLTLLLIVCMNLDPPITD